MVADVWWQRETRGSAPMRPTFSSSQPITTKANPRRVRHGVPHHCLPLWPCLSEHGTVWPAHWLPLYHTEASRTLERLGSISLHGPRYHDVDTNIIADHTRDEWDTVTGDGAGSLAEGGLLFSEYRHAFSEQQGAVPVEIRVRVGSRPMLLVATDQVHGFRSHNAVTRRIRTSKATALAHLIPDMHDTQTLSTLQSLFDAEWLVTAGATPAEWDAKRG